MTKFMLLHSSRAATNIRRWTFSMERLHTDSILPRFILASSMSMLHHVTDDSRAPCLSVTLLKSVLQGATRPAARDVDAAAAS